MHLKVTLSRYQFSGAKASAPAAFHPHRSLSLSLCPPHTACLSFPLKEGLIVAMSAVSRAPRTKRLFTPLPYPPCIRHSLTSHSLLLTPRIMQSPRLFATPPPPHPPRPTAATPPTPLFLFSHLCFGVCGGITAPGEHARQEQVEVVTETMVVTLQKY